MKKFYKKGIGVALAVTMASSGVVAYAAEATKDAQEQQALHQKHHQKIRK